MRRRSLLLLLLGIVAVLFLNSSTTHRDIARLERQMTETQRVLFEVNQASYGRDVELARWHGVLKACVEDTETGLLSLEKRVLENEVRIADLEDPNMVGVLRALANTVTVLLPSGGHGSGVVLMDGFVLTAGHCSGVTTVQTLDGAVYGVESEYVHPDYDVAILCVPGIEGGIELAVPDEPELFDRMFVIGTPFDPLVEGTVSEGIFINHDRDIWYWEDTYQVTCDAGPGNSGGPVVDERGRLVGIVVGGPDPGGAVTICEPIAHIIAAMNSYK